MSTERRFSVNEVFGPTIQGEGALAGALTHFIRFNGCDYRCSWCDSMEAVDPHLIKLHHQPMTTEEIVEKVKSLPPAKWVTLSGGNPAIHPDLGGIIEGLQWQDFKVACETQGSVAQDWMYDLNHLVLSPKPPSSGQPPVDWKVIRRILGNYSHHPERYSVKIVVFTLNDLSWATDTGASMCGENPLYIQVGTQKGESLEEMAANYLNISEAVKGSGSIKNLDIRVLPQLHKYLYGHGRGV